MDQESRERLEKLEELEAREHSKKDTDELSSKSTKEGLEDHSNDDSKSNLPQHVMHGTNGIEKKSKEGSRIKPAIEWLTKLAGEAVGGTFKWFFKIMFILILLAAFADLSGELDSGTKLRGGYEYQTEVLQQVEEPAGRIAVVNMVGEIVEYSPVSAFSEGAYIPVGGYSALFDLLASQKDVKAVVLVIDSPGGEVYASDELYRYIKKLDQKKPVFVYAKSTLASGAYYVAVGASKIYANRLSVVGSIGVMVELINYDGLLQKLGIKVRRMTNTGGVYKTGEGLFDNDPNGEEDRMMQRLLDDAFNRFVEVVSLGRRLPVDNVKKIADGRIMTAEDAKKYGLIDKVTTLSQTINDLKDLVGEQKLEVVEYRLSSSGGFLNEIFGVISVIPHVLSENRAGFRLFYELK